MGTATQVAAQQTQHAPGLTVFNHTFQMASRQKLHWLIANIFFCCLPGIAIAGEPSPNEDLLAKYQTLKTALTQSIFGDPILLQSKVGEQQAQGEVYALLDTPFEALRTSLTQPASWCDLAILHINIKTCLYQKDQLTFFVGRKYYQPPDEAFALHYNFQSQRNDKQQLWVTLTAKEGPLGTSDYLIQLQAVAVDTQHSFIHFQYRYGFGLMAELAMKTYLATLGRNKVGFTVTGTDDHGQPTYIKGQQGVIERNVMRYIFAIESVLEAKKSAKEYQPKEGMQHWYAHIQKHPRQLVEVSRKEYIENKQHELSNQLIMQKELPP